MSDWKSGNLGQLVRLQRGHDLTETERTPGEVPVMGSAGLNGYHGSSKAKGPGVIIGRSGASFGRIHYSDVDFWPHNTALYVTDFLGNDEKFVFYFLSTIDFSYHNSGSAQPSLNRNYVYSIPVKIPPVEEQKSISFALSSLDDKINLNRKLNETLEQMARALFQSWFVDFDPVKAKLAAKRHGRDPEHACMAAISGKLRIPAGRPRAERLDDQLPTADGLDAAITALDTLTEAQRQQLAETAIRFPDEFRESELGLIPVGWSVGDLNEFSELNSNSWTERNHPSEVAYVDLANCKNGCILSVQHYDWDSAPSRARRRLIEGDTIFGTVRPGNRSFALIGETGTRLTGSTGFAVLSPRKPQFREFVYLHATSEDNINRLTHLADGAAYPAVRPDIVAKYQIVSPSEAVLVSFSKLVSDSFLLIQKHEHQSRTLAELRNTLLPKLLSGELSVSAAEDAMAAAES